VDMHTDMCLVFSGCLESFVEHDRIWPLSSRGRPRLVTELARHVTQNDDHGFNGDDPEYNSLAQIRNEAKCLGHRILSQNRQSPNGQSLVCRGSEYHSSAEFVHSTLHTAHKKGPMHKICPTLVYRPDHNLANISEFSPSNLIHIGPLCSVTYKRKKVPIWLLNINDMLIKAKM
jgi:hypothetical protein